MTISLLQLITDVRQEVGDTALSGPATGVVWTDTEVIGAIIKAQRTCWPNFYIGFDDETTYTGNNTIGINTIEVAVPPAFLASGLRGIGKIDSLEARVWDGTSTATPVPADWFVLTGKNAHIQPLTSPSPKIRLNLRYSQKYELRIHGRQPLTPPTNYLFTAAAATSVFTVVGSTDVWTNGQTISLSGQVSTGVTASTTYYLVNVSGQTFKLSDTPGGAAKTLTSDSSGNFYVTSNAVSGSDNPGILVYLVHRTAEYLHRSRVTSSQADRDNHSLQLQIEKLAADDAWKRYRMTPEREMLYGKRY